MLVHGNIASTIRTNQNVYRSALIHTSDKDMKRALLIFPIAAGLVSCVDKKQVCAQYAADSHDIANAEVLIDTYKKLGIRGEILKRNSAHKSIVSYCEFYK